MANFLFMTFTLVSVPKNKLLRVNVEWFGPPDQARLTWRPLSNYDARGNIILYKLQWRSIDGEFSNVRYIDGASEEFTITGITLILIIIILNNFLKIDA